MLRKLLILNTFLISLTWCLPTQAAQKECRSESACFKPHVKYRVANNQLVDVCDNYRSGDWKYRRCRAEASRLFKDKCHSLQTQLRNEKGSRRDSLRKQRDIYCDY